MSLQADLKKKFSMIAAILPVLKLSKGVRGTETVALLETKVNDGKEALAEENLDLAKSIGLEAGKLLLKCGEALPAAARRVALPKIKQICRYGV
jgi:hypothetical protein